MQAYTLHVLRYAALPPSIGGHQKHCTVFVLLTALSCFICAICLQIWRKLHTACTSFDRQRIRFPNNTCTVYISK